jgi:hypothetical protein
VSGVALSPRFGNLVLAFSKSVNENQLPAEFDALWSTLTKNLTVKFFRTFWKMP